MNDCGLDPEKVIAMADIDASDKYRQWRINESPSITRTRSRSGGWYLTSHQRRTCTEERVKLQGMVPENVGPYESFPRRDIDAAIGNAMSANVLERLLPAVAYASGVLSNKPCDAWLREDFIKKGGRFAKK